MCLISFNRCAPACVLFRPFSLPSPLLWTLFSQSFSHSFKKKQEKKKQTERCQYCSFLRCDFCRRKCSHSRFGNEREPWWHGDDDNEIPIGIKATWLDSNSIWYRARMIFVLLFCRSPVVVVSLVFFCIFSPVVVAILFSHLRSNWS